jgi:hypothetical protein
MVLNGSRRVKTYNLCWQSWTRYSQYYRDEMPRSTTIIISLIFPIDEKGLLRLYVKTRNQI